ncbi:MAG: hypothetical protein FWG14_06470 [Peptococcaceae bacterium]|nr:hypothetical protein [Peptococcaceae bacterium]
MWRSRVIAYASVARTQRLQVGCESPADGDHRYKRKKTERWQYAYDPLGRRIEKRRIGEGGNPEETAKFYWDGSRLLAEDCDGRHPVSWVTRGG